MPRLTEWIIRMPWFPVGDNMAFNAAVCAAGNAAFGLYCRAGSWASDQLTDGHIPAHMARQLGTRGEAQKLVSVGLWESTVDGYQFAPWPGKTRADIESERKAAKYRMQQLRSPDVRPNSDRTSGEPPPNNKRGSAEVPATFGRSSFTNTKPIKDSPTPPAAPAGPGCAKHRQRPGANCRACGTNTRAVVKSAAAAAKQSAAEQRRAAVEARRAAVERCRLCDADGRLPGGGVCDHDPDRITRARRGSAAARAVLTARKDPA